MGCFLPFLRSNNAAERQDGLTTFWNAALLSRQPKLIRMALWKLQRSLKNESIDRRMSGLKIILGEEGVSNTVQALFMEAADADRFTYQATLLQMLQDAFEAQVGLVDLLIRTSRIAVWVFAWT